MGMRIGVRWSYGSNAGSCAVWSVIDSPENNAGSVKVAILVAY